jgi:hypothetical protein
VSIIPSASITKDTHVPMPLKKIGLGWRSEQGGSVSAEISEGKEVVIFFRRDCLGRGAVLKLI